MKAMQDLSGLEASKKSRTTTVLDVQNLCKNFDGTDVLKDISFTVNEGEFVAIMGQSGSGKSTLLYAISGMDKPSSGTVVLGGKDISQLGDDEMSKVRLNQMGFVFQHSHLLKNLSIRDNIVLPGFKAGMRSREEVNHRADNLMIKMGIADVGHHDIKKVSGGQLQRAAICRALINEPDILFGDEPTGALNSSTTREVIETINGINAEGTTVIIVTHNAKVASRASRVVFLMDGKIHDELTLGHHGPDESAISSREKRLSAWLGERGF